MKRTTIAMDLAKNVFEIAVSLHPGKVAETHRLSRAKLLRFFAQRESSVVLMEACTAAHHWARELKALGHQPVLLPPAAIRPYVQRGKTDRSDAKGLLEAYRNEEIHPVPIKSIEQQTVTAIHTMRSQWLKTRTARINLVRGLLRELGVFIPVGSRRVVPRVFELISDAESVIPDPLRAALAEACREIQELEEKVKCCEEQLRSLAQQMPQIRNLQSIPGIGLLSASALVAFVGDVQRFPTGRHFASYLGLTPKEHSSGQVRRLGRISKRGNPYLRTLLVHGARSVLWSAKHQDSPDALRSWGLHIEHNRGHNKAAVAVANKMARIVWAVCKTGKTYQSLHQAA